MIRGFNRQMSGFSGIIAKDLSNPKQKLLQEMLYGIEAAKDMKLSSITWTLNERIHRIKTENHLSRNLDERDLTEEIQMCHGGACVGSR